MSRKGTDSKQPLGSQRLTLFVITAWVAIARQIDDFEDGATRDWGQGNDTPDSPANVARGGPGGGGFSTTSEVDLPAGSGWRTVYFDKRAANWASVGGSSIADTPANAEALRLLHNADPK